MTSFFFFFNDTATTEIYTLSLHDALPISCAYIAGAESQKVVDENASRVEIDNERVIVRRNVHCRSLRSEEHTSELQSLRHLVCRLLLEKKKIKQNRAVPLTK